MTEILSKAGYSLVTYRRREPVAGSNLSRDSGLGMATWVNDSHPQSTGGFPA
ncbi:MAG TPA: hypothetical protein VFG23_16545 [Polyangia bacterium]|nr:hypothetical protein [Polyangia bacterium]